MGETMIIMRKRLIPGTRAEEGLRLSAAMLGMDYMPNMVFVDDGVDILLPDALYKNNLKDYLTVMSDMAGVYVLKESLELKELKSEDLDTDIDITFIDFEGLAEMSKRCSIVTSF